MKKLLPISIFLILPCILSAQSSISLETQAYPAGLIPGIRFDYSISQQAQLFLRAGYNFTDRRDWGEHDNEEGGGAGLGIGAEFKVPQFQNFSLNVRTDLWFMEIDWRDFRYIPCPPEMNCTQTLDAVPRLFEGTSETIVIQPTIGLGYELPFSDSFFIKPTINFGYEINIRTNGEDVGEGAILLGGLRVGYSF